MLRPLLLLLLAGCPRTGVQALAADAGACGRWTATVTASGSGRLQLRTDGELTAEWPVRGEQSYVVEGQGTPGASVTLQARLGASRVQETITLPPVHAALDASPLGLVIHEGREPRFDLRATSACDTTMLRWEATARQSGVVREGAFLGGVAWIVLPSEQRGVYDVDVRLLGPDGAEIQRLALSYEVVPPP